MDCRIYVGVSIIENLKKTHVYILASFDIYCTCGLASLESELGFIPEE